jgi:hypothetical protein
MTSENPIVIMDEEIAVESDEEIIESIKVVPNKKKESIVIIDEDTDTEIEEEETSVEFPFVPEEAHIEDENNKQMKIEPAPSTTEPAQDKLSGPAQNEATEDENISKDREPYEVNIDMADLTYTCSGYGGFFLLQKPLPSNLHGTSQNGINIRTNFLYLVEETVKKTSYIGREDENICKAFNIPKPRVVIRKTDPLPANMASRVFPQSISIPLEMIPSTYHQAKEASVFSGTYETMVNITKDDKTVTLTSTNSGNRSLAMLDTVFKSSELESLKPNEKKKLLFRFPKKLTSLGKGAKKYKTDTQNAVLRVQFK